MTNRLRVLRAAERLSQGALAEKLGVSRQTINAIENDKYDPSLSLAFKIASTFNLPIEGIFQADGEEFETPLLGASTLPVRSASS